MSISNLTFESTFDISVTIFDVVYMCVLAGNLISEQIIRFLFVNLAKGLF